jgi:hypothetical protein
MPSNPASPPLSDFAYEITNDNEWELISTAVSQTQLYWTWRRPIKES